MYYERNKIQYENKHWNKDHCLIIAALNSISSATKYKKKKCYNFNVELKKKNVKCMVPMKWDWLLCDRKSRIYDELHSIRMLLLLTLNLWKIKSDFNSKKYEAWQRIMEINNIWINNKPRTCHWYFIKNRHFLWIFHYYFN